MTEDQSEALTPIVAQTTEQASLDTPNEVQTPEPSVQDNQPTPIDLGEDLEKVAKATETLAEDSFKEIEDSAKDI